jgi:PAS domain S-box-containing protein
MNPQAPAIFIHDTRHIISANSAACVLFRCEEVALVDLDMMELIADPDLRGLARLRMRVIREQDINQLRDIKYPFRRCDGTVFIGSVISRLLDDGNVETTVKYEGEA